MSNRFPNPENQYLDAQGLPLAGGKLYFYESGSSTPLATYNDPDLAFPHLNSNPVILDTTGATGDIFLQLLPYKVTLTDSSDVEVWTADPVDLSDITTVAQFAVYAGNPNGHVAGTAGSGSVASSVIWDTTDAILYVCTTTGDAASAVWTAVASQLSGAIVFSSVITPTALAADTNNWAPTGFSTAYAVRVSSSSAIVLTGIAGGASGRDILLENIGSYIITIPMNSTSSTTGNRFVGPSPIVLRPSEAVSLAFDGTSNGWRRKDPVSGSPVAGGFKNLVVTGTSATQATLTADALTLEDANGCAYRAMSVSLTVDITASGANGLDTGAEASSTWYAYWAIYNPQSNTLAGLLSTASTLAGITLPAGYTFGARFGWVRNDGSSNLYRTIQHGTLAQYIVGTNPVSTLVIASNTTGTYSATSPTLASTSVTTFVPSTASAIALCVTRGWKAGSAAAVLVAPNTAWGGTNRGPSGSVGNIYPLWITTDPALDIQYGAMIPLESTQVLGVAIGAAAGGALGMTGWIDNI